MNRLAAILPASNVLVQVDASSKKRAFEQAGLLFENQHAVARAEEARARAEALAAELNAELRGVQLTGTVALVDDVDPDGAEVPLTGGEYELLIALVERPNRVLTRDMLMDLLRGRQAGPFDRAIDVAVSRLEAGEDPEKIEADMGDIFGDMMGGEEGAMGGGGGSGPYSRDANLYDY